MSSSQANGVLFTLLQRSDLTEPQELTQGGSLWTHAVCTLLFFLTKAGEGGLQSPPWSIPTESLISHGQKFREPYCIWKLLYIILTGVQLNENGGDEHLRGRAGIRRKWYIRFDFHWGAMVKGEAKSGWQGEGVVRVCVKNTNILLSHGEFVKM